MANNELNLISGISRDATILWNQGSFKKLIINKFGRILKK